MTSPSAGRWRVASSAPSRTRAARSGRSSGRRSATRTSHPTWRNSGATWTPSSASSQARMPSASPSSTQRPGSRASCPSSVVARSPTSTCCAPWVTRCWAWSPRSTTPPLSPRPPIRSSCKRTRRSSNRYPPTIPRAPTWAVLLSRPPSSPRAGTSRTGRSSSAPCGAWISRTRREGPSASTTTATPSRTSTFARWSAWAASSRTPSSTPSRTSPSSGPSSPRSSSRTRSTHATIRPASTANPTPPLPSGERAGVRGNLGEGRQLMTTIGIVGLGLLGHAIASRLLRAGHAVVGFDVLPERVGALEALGGKGATSAAAVARSAEAVCTVLPSLATAESAIVGREGVLEGAHSSLAVIQMSTISPRLTEALAREIASRGLGFLDCPVSGTSSMVERGDGIFFVGGERALYERWRPVLESVLPRAVLVGTVGQAMTLKLVANLLVALHSAAAAEALTLARKAGLDLGIVLDVLNSSAASSAMLKVRGPMIVLRDFPAQMKLDLFMKDIHLMQEAAERVGASLPFTDLAERLYEEARVAGHGAEDLAVVATAFEGRGGAAPA